MTAPHRERFTPDDVRVMSLAFDQLCELTRISHPSEKLAAQFAQAIVTVAKSGERKPFSLAHAAMRLVAGSLTQAQPEAYLAAHA